MERQLKELKVTLDEIKKLNEDKEYHLLDIPIKTAINLIDEIQFDHKFPYRVE